MSALSLFRNVCQGVSSIAVRTMYHMTTKQCTSNLTNTFSNKIALGNLLQPFVPMYNITCGLKMKTVLHRRCLKCRVIWKEDRKYIICKAHPRHNQVERKKKPYNTWMLTFASQKRERDW